ncbi:hypothetical protein C8J57DRAFT_1276226 [Mycena rebaudengoi]|nr:hypothetical protein C8J57DRAFT_1276226 [Mycena rebaudengoi]
MIFNIVSAFLLSASLLGVAQGSPMNVTDLEGRQTCSTGFCNTAPCCPGLFCSTAIPPTCGSCRGPGAFCTSFPCCAGFVCTFNNNICTACVATGHTCGANAPCCTGICVTPGVCR